MSTSELIGELKSLPPVEREKVAAALLEDDSWVSQSFREAMGDVERGGLFQWKLHSSKPPGLGE